MEIIRKLNSEILQVLEQYRLAVFEPSLLSSIFTPDRFKNGKLFSENNSEASTSVAYLNQINHVFHNGFPPDMHGLDLNYTNLKRNPGAVPAEAFQRIRTLDLQLDDKLQMILGAKACALKAIYPPKGYIAWHTNWNAPGFNIVLTYSAGGNGYWRHIQPSATSTLIPNEKNLVQIDDSPGWHCKVGYFGGKQEVEKILWHSAFTNELRMTVSYVIENKAIWENMVSELKGS